MRARTDLWEPEAHRFKTIFVCRCFLYCVLVGLGGPPRRAIASGHPANGVFREGVAVRYAWVARHRDSHPVSILCKVLGVSKSGYYAWLDRYRPCWRVSNETTASSGA